MVEPHTRSAATFLVAFVLVVSCAPVTPHHRPDAHVSGSVLLSQIDRALAVLPGGQQVGAVVVQHGGDRVLEHYWAGSPSRRWDADSVTKSIVSTLVGIAIDEGLIRGVHATLAELLPEYARSMTPAVRHVTLEDLLAMRWGRLGDNSDLGRMRHYRRPLLPGLANDRMQGPVRSRFDYSNVAAQLVVSVLERATGGSLLTYARTRLFDPLGIDTTPAHQPTGPPFRFSSDRRGGFAWPVYGDGSHVGWGGMKLRAPDLVKLGRLLLAGGSWHGAEIVSRGWVDLATATHLSTGRAPATGYGYFWWTGEAAGTRAFAAEGYGGQLLEVVPARRLVVVFTTPLDSAEPWRTGVSADALMAVVDDVIAPHFAVRRRRR